MSIIINQAEGVTVFTIQSDRKSKWPLFCQILGTMCYSPVCSVSQRLKQEFGCTLTVLATIQIIVGIMHLVFGILTTTIYGISYNGPVFLWLGGVITAVGFMCILVEKFPSPCLVVLIVVMNIVSAALAVTAIVFYSVDLAQTQYNRWCYLPRRQEDHRYYWTTASPAKKAELDQMFEKKLEEYRICQENWLIVKNIHGGMNIMMIVLTVLQLCVTISWCVLNIKALRKKKAAGQDVEDSELLKPLMDQEISSNVCEKH